MTTTDNSIEIIVPVGEEDGTDDTTDETLTTMEPEYTTKKMDPAKQKRSIWDKIFFSMIGIMIILMFASIVAMLYKISTIR